MRNLCGCRREVELGKRRPRREVVGDFDLDVIADAAGKVDNGWLGGELNIRCGSPYREIARGIWTRRIKASDRIKVVVSRQDSREAGFIEQSQSAIQWKPGGAIPKGDAIGNNSSDGA